MWFVNPLKCLAWRWFREYLAIRDLSQQWTEQSCSHCRAPFARPDATFCYHCGMPLQGGDIVTEPTLLIPREQQQTGALLMQYRKERHLDVGDLTARHRAVLWIEDKV